MVGLLFPGLAGDLLLRDIVSAKKLLNFESKHIRCCAHAQMVNLHINLRSETYVRYCVIMLLRAKTTVWLPLFSTKIHAMTLVLKNCMFYVNLHSSLTKLNKKFLKNYF